MINVIIRYTLDGTDPTASSPVYTEPITITSDKTVKAKAFAEGYESSEVATASYVIQQG